MDLQSRLNTKWTSDDPNIGWMTNFFVGPPSDGMMSGQRSTNSEYLKILQEEKVRAGIPDVDIVLF